MPNENQKTGKAVTLPSINEHLQQSFSVMTHYISIYRELLSTYYEL